MHFSRCGNTVEWKPAKKKYTSWRVWLGKLHLETFLMNYAARQTLVTGEGTPFRKWERETEPENVTLTTHMHGSILSQNLCAYIGWNGWTNWCKLTQFVLVQIAILRCRLAVWRDWARFCPDSLCAGRQRLLRTILDLSRWQFAQNWK